jgi:hypothetical protein
MSTVQCARDSSVRLNTQFDATTIIDHSWDDELIDFLYIHGELQGYSNYWISYPLAFQSSETLIFIPLLPYHQDFRYSARDDRYAPYDKWVENADRVAYITSSLPDLDKRLREEFARLAISWKEEDIGDYHVFYQLSKKIEPGSLDLFPR